MEGLAKKTLYATVSELVVIPRDVFQPFTVFRIEKVGLRYPHISIQVNATHLDTQIFIAFKPIKAPQVGRRDIEIDTPRYLGAFTFDKTGIVGITNLKGRISLEHGRQRTVPASYDRRPNLGMP